MRAGWVLDCCLGVLSVESCTHLHHCLAALGESGYAACRVQCVGHHKLPALGAQHSALPAPKTAVPRSKQAHQQRDVDPDGAQAPCKALEGIELPVLQAVCKRRENTAQHRGTRKAGCSTADETCCRWLQDIRVILQCWSLPVGLLAGGGITGCMQAR